MMGERFRFAIRFFFVALAAAGISLSMPWGLGVGDFPAGPSSNIFPWFGTPAFALDMDDCRCCHGKVADRHHVLAERMTKQCVHCHPVTFDDDSLIYQAQLVRDCLSLGCHVADTTLKDRHHVTVERGRQVCTDCHAVLIEEGTQAYSIELARPCENDEPADPGGETPEHTVASSDCTSCHLPDLYEVHQRDCGRCHESSSATVMKAVQERDTRCVTCHSASPHSVGCRICHGASRTYTPDQKQAVHAGHMKRAACGVCHRVPEKTGLEPSGEYCSLCHTTPKGYDMSGLPLLHREHVTMQGPFPYACYMCHGRSVPPRELTQCLPCHEDKRYEPEDLAQVHSVHNPRFDCSGCHGNPLEFEPSPRVTCLKCRTQRASREGIRMHYRHKVRQCWSCHSSNDVSARAGAACVSCHPTGTADLSSSEVHKEHAGRGYPCWVCHEKLVPIAPFTRAKD